MNVAQGTPLYDPGWKNRKKSKIYFYIEILSKVAKFGTKGFPSFDVRHFGCN